ncbi:MAG: tetratricopeptide repeat protein [Bacteroidota bacterium]
MKQLQLFFPLFFLCPLGYFTLAQEIPAPFVEKVSRIVTAAPTTYHAIEQELQKENRDTVLMNYFLKVSKRNDYLQGQAYAFNQLGTVFGDLLQNPKAEMYYQRALALSEKGNMAHFKAYSLNMLADVYRKTDAIKTALDFYQEALEIAESVENPSNHIKNNINISRNGIGNLYQTLEQHDLAIEQFKKGLILNRELNNKLGLASNHQNIADCLEQKGLLDEALENYRKALAYNEGTKDEMGRMACKNGIAQVYLKKGMPNAALTLLTPLKKQTEKPGHESFTSLVLVNNGWAYLKLGDFKSAEDHLKKGLQLAQYHNLKNIALTAFEHLSELEVSKGDYASALGYYKMADTYDEEIANAINLRYMNDVIQRYEAEKKNNQIEVLAQENEIVRLRLRKNQTTLLVSALALGLVASILYILYRKYQSNNEKKVLSLEQNMLRSQMNPHFLFNSLNSIKLYIINNEQKNAVHYLNKFSKLVRKILEASSNKEISLAEELETIELYMNIENIRFSNEIDFNISIEDQIDVNQIKIPSLALQPFLENALWHGLSPKEGEKKITLRVFKKNNGHVTITIEDNGVGRAIAKVNKENRVLKRKSVGIDITKERLANFSKDYQNNFEVQIIDLFSKSGLSRGTRVVIEIPTF